MGKIMEKIKDIFYIARDKIKNAYVKIKNALTRFFERALSFLKSVIKKLEQKIRSVILGSTHFFRRIGNKYQEGSKNYILDEEIGEWKEMVVTREIQIEELPPTYRTMDDEFEIDDTEELDAVLGY